MHLVILIFMVLPRLTSVLLILVMVEEKMDHLVLKFGLMVLVEPNQDGLHLFKQRLLVKVQNLLPSEKQEVVFYTTSSIVHLLDPSHTKQDHLLFTQLVEHQNVLSSIHVLQVLTLRFLVLLNRTLYLTGMVLVLYHSLVMQLRDKQTITGLQVHYGLGQVEKRREHTITMLSLHMSYSITKIMV